MSTQKLLLLEDVDGLGRKGDLVSGAKPGFIRNFLLPKKVAVFADKRTIRMQERLKEERAKQAVVDKKGSEELASKINDQVFSIDVKVDLDGHMYGSVSAADIVKLLEGHAIAVERKNVILPLPIKKLGVHSIALRLKEGVPATFTLNVVPESTEEEKV